MCDTQILTRYFVGRATFCGAGLPTGDYRVVNTRGNTQAKGSFKAGKMEGLWVFYDSRSTRTAEIRYHHGVASGDFRFYFSALAFPQAAGHLKTEGRVEGGHLVGEHVGYAPDGAFISHATFNLHGEIKPSAGTLHLARQLAGADYQLLDGTNKDCGRLVIGT